MVGRSKPTLADVARAARVSPATASKALNGRLDVAASTRERVLAAVAELGYRTGTSPVPGTSRRALAVVFDLPASPYILNVLQGVLASATDAHLDLLTRLAPDRATRTQHATARAWIADQRSAGAVGIVGLTLSEPDGLLAAAADAGLPFVMVDPVDARHRPMMSVRSSNWAGARAAADHLIALGHRRIAWVGGPDASTPARDRFYGYRAALESAGIELDPALVRSDRFDVDAGARHARDLLTMAHPPTAIMAADDEIAVGVLATAHELGVQVPGAAQRRGLRRHATGRLDHSRADHRPPGPGRDGAAGRPDGPRHVLRGAPAVAAHRAGDVADRAGHHRTGSDAARGAVAGQGRRHWAHERLEPADHRRVPQRTAATSGRTGSARVSSCSTTAARRPAPNASAPWPASGSTRTRGSPPRPRAARRTTPRGSTTCWRTRTSRSRPPTTGPCRCARPSSSAPSATRAGPGSPPARRVPLLRAAHGAHDPRAAAHAPGHLTPADSSTLAASATLPRVHTRSKAFVAATVVLVVVALVAVLVERGVIWPNRLLAAQYEVRGVDVSSYQGAIDWPVLAGQDIDFAYVKATEGSGFVDDTFADEPAGRPGGRRARRRLPLLQLREPGRAQAENIIATVPADEGCSRSPSTSSTTGRSSAILRTPRRSARSSRCSSRRCASTTASSP